MAASVISSIVVSAVAGGVASSAAGGSFGQGAKMGAIGGAVSGFAGLAGVGAGAGSGGATGGLLGGTSGGLGSAASTAIGIYQAQQMQSMAKQAFKGSDPFGPYRSQYADQLSALSANPALLKNMPSYQWGMDQGTQAVSRRMAASGYAGSGNEAIELMKFGQGYAGQMLTGEQARLATLAGANIAPNYGPGLQGYAMGMDQWGRVLANMGYGAPAGGAAPGGGGSGGGYFVDGGHP